MKLWFSLLAMVFLASACSRPPQPQAPSQPGPKIEQKELKPEIWPVPEQVKQALPGLQNDNIYVYREISPTVNLVAYFPEYSLPDAVRRMAEAFVALTRDPKFTTGIEFWIIQVQPKQGSEVIVWGVRPSEALAYAQIPDLPRFFSESEYLLVNDKIIPSGPDRLSFLNPPQPQ